jgi:hypothetical protein
MKVEYRRVASMPCSPDRCPTRSTNIVSFRLRATASGYDEQANLNVSTARISYSGTAGV